MIIRDGRKFGPLRSFSVGDIVGVRGKPDVVPIEEIRDCKNSKGFCQAMYGVRIDGVLLFRHPSQLKLIRKKDDND